MKQSMTAKAMEKRKAIWRQSKAAGMAARRRQQAQLKQRRRKYGWLAAAEISKACEWRSVMAAWQPAK